MRIISSQHYRDEAKVEAKAADLRSPVTLPVIHYADDLYVLVDGHHTHEAATREGVEIRYEVLTPSDDDRAALSGQDLLDALWLDGDWYYLDTGKLVW
ncbi:MAG: hypothetical protein ACLFWG_00275 [Longimicrobiales bacterium]